MSPPVSPHPDPDTLRSFGLGLLDEPELERISGHLAGCDACRSAVEAVPPDAMIDALRTGDTVPSEAGAASTLTGPYSPESAPVPEVPPELTDHPRYRVLQLLGWGGMGAVYKTEHRVMERVVAVKVINPRWMRDPAMVERFDREVKAAARLAHPNIVAAYDAESAGDSHFLVMEYVEGTRLDRVVEQGGPLSVRQACDYACQAARGLEHAHQRGMVHRDIKPHNLILTPHGQIKILDFGLARFVSEMSRSEPRPDAATAPPAGPGSLTGAGDVLGTAEYMAPEQVHDAHQADIRADIYALGCTLYHMLTGHPPFPRGRTLEKLIAQVEETPPPLVGQRPDVPPRLARAVEQMLAKDPAERFQTPAEVVAALTPFADPPRRRRTRVLAALLALVLVAAGVVVRIATDNGELVIETDDANVEVIVLDGGKQVALLDAKTGHTTRLRVGEYGLRLADDKAHTLTTDHITVRRGETAIAKVSLKPPEAKKQPDNRPGPGTGRPSVESPPRPVELALVEGRSLVGHRKQVNALTVSPDGRRVVSAGHDKVVRLWDIATGAELRRFEGHTEDLICAAISADGKRLLTAGGGGLWKDGRWQATDFRVRLWDMDTGDELRQFRGHSDLVNAVRFLPDGKRAISASTDSTLRLWDLDTGRELRVFEGHHGGVAGLGLTSDGTRAVSGGFDRTVRVWDMATGRQVFRFDEHTGNVRAVDVSPDGTQAVSAGDDRRVLLWDVVAGKLLRTFSGTAANWGKGPAMGTSGPGTGRSATSGHQTLVMSVAFSPDGRRVVSGGGYTAGAKLPTLHRADDSVRVWDVATGHEIGRYTGHTNYVRAVTFAEGGRAVLSAGADKAVRVLWLAPRSPARSDPPAGRGVLVLDGDAPPLPVLVRQSGRVAAVLAAKDHPAEALPPGEYDLALAAGADEWRLSASRLRVEAGGKHMVKLTRVPAVAAPAPVALRELKPFNGHTAAVVGVAASPDGRLAATCSDDNTVRLWDLQTGAERRLVGQDDAATTVTFFPDGSRLVTGGGWNRKDGKTTPTDFSVRIWDVATGKELRRFLGHTNSVISLAVSPDRKRLLSGSNDSTVRLWEVETGRLLHVLYGHEWFVSSVAFSPDGRLGLSASWDATVRLWDLETGREVRKFEGHTEWVWSASFSPDGRLVLTGSTDRTARLWEVASGREVGRLVHPTGVKGAAFSPDGRRALTVSGTKMLPDGSGISAGYDHVVRLWDLDTSREIGRFEGHTAEPLWAAFTPDGKSALSVGHDRTVRPFALPDPKRPLITEVRSFPGPTMQVNNVAFTPDGRRVLSACCDGKVRVCDRDTGKEVFVLEQPGEVWGLAVSPDGRRVLTGGGRVPAGGKFDRSHCALRLWDLETGREIRRLEGHENIVQSVAFTPDGRRALSGGYDNTLRLWDIETGRQLRLFAGHENVVLSVALSADGHLALSASWDGTVRLWEVATGRELRRMVGHVGRVHRVLFTPDGRHALSSGTDRTLRMWDLLTGREVRRFAGHATGVSGLALSPDGRFLLSGSGGDDHKGVAGFDNVVRLWGVAAGGELARFEGHPDAVCCVSFAPDGRQAVSASSTVRLLQLPQVPAADPPPAAKGPREMAEILCLTGHRNTVNGLALTRDGRFAVSASFDDTLRVWDLASGKEVRRLSDGPEQYYCVAVSGDGKTAVAASGSIWKDGRWQHSDYAVAVFDLTTGQLRHRMTAPTGRIWAVAVTPDGTHAITGSDDQTVRLWDLTTGREKSAVRNIGSTMLWLVALPDGKRAAAAMWDGTFRVFDVEAGRELLRLDQKGAGGIRVALAPDGRHVLSGNGDGRVRLWDVETGRLVRTYAKHPTIPFALAFTPDGKRFLTGSGEFWDADVGGRRTTTPAGYDNCVRLWDTETGEELARFDGHTNGLRDIAVTPDGRFAVTASLDGTIRVLLLPEAAPRKAPAGAGRLAFADKSLHAFVIVRQQGHVVAAIHPRWEPAADLPPGDYDLEIARRPDGLRLTPDKITLGKGESRSVMIEWLPPPEPPPALREVRRFEGHTTWITQVAFAPDNKRFASCSWDRFVRIWDAETGQEVRKLEHPEEVWAVAWSPDGKYLAAAGGGLWKGEKFTLADHSVRLWDVAEGKEVRRFVGHTGGRVNFVTFAPDGSRLLSAGDDLTARLWDVETGKELRVFRDHKQIVAGVAFSPDGKRALSACHDGLVRLWDVETGELLRRLEGHTRPVQGVVFLKGGTRAATAGQDRTIRIWDLATGEQVRVIAPPTAASWLAATPRGELLAGGGVNWWGVGLGYDNRVSLWDAETGRELGRFTGHTESPWSVAVSPDGRRAISAGQDRIIRLFELPE